MLYSSLASCISESLPDSQTRCHLSSTNIWIIKFYKYKVGSYGWILHTELKGEWCGFLQLPLCVSAGIKCFPSGHYCLQQEDTVYFGQVGGSATISQKGTRGCGWAGQLEAMACAKAKTYGGCHNSQVTEEFLFWGRREPWWLINSWHLSPSMQVPKTIHSAFKTHSTF